jgi:hypothetical protein
MSADNIYFAENKIVIWLICSNYFTIFDIANLDMAFTNKKIMPIWKQLLEQMIINVNYYDNIYNIKCIYKRMQFFNYIVRNKIKLNCDYIFGIRNGVSSYHITESDLNLHTTENMLSAMLMKSTNLITLEIDIHIDWVEIIKYIPMIKKNNPNIKYINISIINIMNLYST